MMNREQLNEFRYDYAEKLLGENHSVEVDGVRFTKFCNSIAFCYGNASGLIFADNGYLGELESGLNYYPLLRLSAKYSNNCKYNPNFAPNLISAAVAVKQSWKDFTK
jgi:hypothetical protein